MNTGPRRVLGAALVAVGVSAGLGVGLRPHHGAGPEVPLLSSAPTWDAQSDTVPRDDLIPAAFVANDGQWDSTARFVLLRRGLVVEVRPGGLVCRSRYAGAGDALALAFAGAHEGAVEGVDPLPGERHYFLGNDPSRWRTHVKAFAQVVWRDVYPGIDVRLVPTADGLRYDLLLAPGADLGRVLVRYSGHTSLQLDPGGSLALGTVRGPVRQSPPVAWHELPGGGRVAATCRFVPVDDVHFGFELEGARLDLPLVVDPGLDFYVFLGGSFMERLNAVVEASDGTLVVVGQTQAADFPATAGAAQPNSGGGDDGFIARMDARARTLIWATYLGGSQGDDVTAVALNATGETFVTGSTVSTDFPVTPGAFGTRRRGWSTSAFVTRLRQDGSALVYSTYLGGSGYEDGYSIAVGPGNEAFVAGGAHSPDFPVTPGAFRTNFSGGNEAFLSRVDATGTSLVASTFFGGNTSFEEGLFVSVHSTGYVTLGGWTQSSDLPVTPNAFQSSLRGTGTSAFFAVLDPQLATTSLLYGTYYGGSMWEANLHFSQNSAGQLVIVGRTGSPDLPGARGNLQGLVDMFAAVFDPFQLVAARYINTSDNSGPYAAHIDATGIVTFSAGMAAGFPTTAGAWQTVPRTALGAGFVARLGPNLDLWYASYFGGTVGDGPDALSRTRDGWTLLGGRGASPELPTPGVFNTTLRGMNDGFVARMDLLPTGVERYGVSSGACLGPIVMDVTRMPAAGAATFSVVCSAAPPSAPGWLVLGAAPDPAGTPVSGAILHVDARRGIVLLPAFSTTNGLGAVTVPLAPGWHGARVYAQFVWVNPPACRGSGLLSSSHALEIVVQ